MASALLEGAADIFERGGRKTAEVDDDTVRDRHAEIGELAVANDPAPGLRGPAGATVPGLRRGEGSSPGPASEARHGRARPPGPVDRRGTCRLLSTARSLSCHVPPGETDTTSP